MPKRALMYMGSVFGTDQNALIQRDGSNRFLPFIVAVMVFLALLALSTVFLVHNKITDWRQVLTGTLTLQILPDEVGEVTEDLELRVASVLSDHRGITGFRKIGEEETAQLLSTWFGEEGLPADLPLPTVFDVQSEGADIKALQGKLNQMSDRIVMDSHQSWLEKVIRLIQRFQLVGIVAVVLILLAAISVVVISTKTAMAVHGETIEILHLIGAKDFFIAFQFARKAFVVSFLGSVLGAVLAAVLVLVIALAAQDLALEQFSSILFSPLQVGVLAGLPMLAAILTMAVAAWTVSATLKRMT